MQENREQMDQKMQEECKQMTTELQSNMEQELQKKFEAERAHVKGEVDKMIIEQMAALMTRMQQGQSS